MTDIPDVETGRAGMARRMGAVLELAERPGTAGEREATISAAARLFARDPVYWRGRLAEPTPAPWPAREPYGDQSWRDVVVSCLSRCARLTAWETRFLASLLDFHFLSEKQQTVLDRIAERVRSGEAA
ncbi:MAG: hypothetical protein ACREFZ_07185 [Acetobacteraceae bacterium]